MNPNLKQTPPPAVPDKPGSSGSTHEKEYGIVYPWKPEGAHTARHTPTGPPPWGSYLAELNRAQDNDTNQHTNEPGSSF